MDWLKPFSMRLPARCSVGAEVAELIQGFSIGIGMTRETTEAELMYAVFPNRRYRK